MVSEYNKYCTGSSTNLAQFMTKPAFRRSSLQLVLYNSTNSDTCQCVEESAVKQFVWDMGRAEEAFPERKQSLWALKSKKDYLTICLVSLIYVQVRMHSYAWISCMYVWMSLIMISNLTWPDLASNRTRLMQIYAHAMTVISAFLILFLPNSKSTYRFI